MYVVGLVSVVVAFGNALKGIYVVYVVLYVDTSGRQMLRVRVINIDTSKSVLGTQ